ncbi:MAG: Gfo/Idh/MocA family oxidoreductase [Flavitalea sp.]
MSKISWGIIGCGDVTEIKSGPAFNNIKNSHLQAVMRRNAEKATDYAKRHHVPTWYTNADALINDPNVNAIYIATPPSSHEEYAIAALKAGKPVYVEKPMTTDGASAKRISEASIKLGIKLCVAHYRRQLPLFKKIKQLLDEKHIGRVQFVQLQLLQPVSQKGFELKEGNWRLDPATSGGGYFHDLAPHQLDLIYYYFGKPQFTKGISLNQGGYYKTDDTVAGTASFKNGIVMNGLWSFVAPEIEATENCRIIGTEGTISFSIFKIDKLFIIKNGQQEELTFERTPHVQQPMIEKVVPYFLNQGENPCSADDGVVVMEMIDAFTKRPD